MSGLRRIVFLTAAVIGIGTLCVSAQDTPPQTAAPVLHAPAAEPDYKSDPKFQKALADAQQKHQTTDDRLANWKHANKVAKNQCGECLHEMVVLDLHKREWKDAIASATQLDAVSTDPSEKAFAEGERGIALLQMNNGQPKGDDLKAAEESLHAALVLSPRTKTFVFNDGRALAMMGRDDEAKAAFERYLNIAKSSDRYRMRAEHFVDNPKLAALPMAPPFTVTTSDGQELQLDDMGGKVVLLDFWATWCGPCKATLPEVAQIVRDYASDPMLVVISVSRDHDEHAWKTFVEKNNMKWPQYRDANNALASAYGVSTIPHFFTIDTNGLLKTEQVGSNADVRRVVNDLVKKGHKAEAEKARASEKSNGQ